MRSLVTLADPVTGELRLASGSDDNKVRVLDPVAGGAALVVLDGGGQLAVFKGQDGRTAARDGSNDGKVCIFDPVAGGEALLVIDIGGEVSALAAAEDPATGAPRLHAHRE